ncbi:hypothetical protein [Vibrio sp. McD22-P3]|uniref:hypothetical protein n=1 Tax=Vibrio sp. McD22-P3 TaxID=2724880 RepID=UPI001F48CDB2|nr:hypothetical protein [Vibrio sp. McD22-P3]MCF4174681.1 hypothetical protein [Vibrio sp. McD22-P3]
MQSVNSNLMSQTNAPVATAAKTVAEGATANGNTLPIGNGDSVSISPQAKAMLEKEVSEGATKENISKGDDDSVGKSVTSFAHGALGMDHPDDLEKQEDSSYSAGQYVSAAVTIGALILALA